MNTRTIIALIVFALLLVGALLSTREKAERGITRISFADVDPATVTRIVTTGKSSIELEKQDDKWVLKGGKRADAVAVKQLLDALPKIQSADLATSNDKRFAELEVDDEKGTRIEVFAGDRKVADFVVGKGARAGAYERVDDSVYSVRGVFPQMLARDSSAWIERKLFDIDPKEVARVEITPYGANTFALVKKDQTWDLEDPSILPAGFRFDQGAALTLASSAINARAKDVLDADPGADKTGLPAEADKVTLVASGDRKVSLSIGKDTEDKAGVYAKADGWPEVVTLFAHSARALRKTPTDMRDLSVMKIDPKTVKRVAVAHGSENLVLAKDGESWKIDSSSAETPMDFELDPNKVRQRIFTVSSLRALALADPGSSTGFDKPSATVTVTQDDGTEAVLAFGGDTKQDDREAVFVRGNADQDSYVVARFARDNVVGGIETFSKDAAGAPGGMPGMPGMPPGMAAPGMPGQLDPKALESLPPEVRKSLEAQIQEQRRRQMMMEAAKQGGAS